MRISNQENFKSSSATELSCRMAKNMFAFIGWEIRNSGTVCVSKYSCISEELKAMIKLVKAMPVKMRHMRHSVTHTVFSLLIVSCSTSIWPEASLLLPSSHPTLPRTQTCISPQLHLTRRSSPSQVPRPVSEVPTPALVVGLVEDLLGSGLGSPFT